MLLIDEIDRADHEFEAFLLEFLSDFPISIPERGTLRAHERPVVDPDLEPHARAARGAAAALRLSLDRLSGSGRARRGSSCCARRASPRRPRARSSTAVGRLRHEPLTKPPGVAEAIDWAEAATLLRRAARRWPDAFRRSIGVRAQGRGGSRLHRAAARRYHRGDRGMTALALPRAARPLLDFIALLRRNGFSVAPEQSRPFCGAIELLGPRDIEDIRRAGVPRWRRRSSGSPISTCCSICIFSACRRAVGSGRRKPDEELQVQDDGAGSVTRRCRDDINETGQAATATRGAVAARASAGRRQPRTGAFQPAAPARLPRRRGYRMRAAKRGAASTCSARCATPSAPTARSSAAPARTPAAAARHPAADRRVGLDEGAHRRASALCPCAGPRAPPRRGVHVRHAADAADPRAAAEEPRAGAGRRGRPRGRLGRRHADRRCAGRLPRGAALRRLCPRRAGARAVRRARARRPGADDPRGRASRRARLADRLADPARRRPPIIARRPPRCARCCRCSTASPMARPRSGCAGTFSTCHDGGPPDDSACARLRRCASSHLAAAGSALAARADAAADLWTLRADPPRLHHRGISGGCRRRRRHAIGLRAGELGEGAFPR